MVEPSGEDDAQGERTTVDSSMEAAKASPKITYLNEQIDESGRRSRLQALAMLLFRMLPSTRPFATARQERTRRQDDRFETKIFVTHTIAGVEQLKVASCYPDTGLRLRQHAFKVDGRRTEVDGLIQLSFLEQSLPDLKSEIKPVPEGLKELECFNGTKQRIHGWLQISCFMKEESMSVTFPRRKWQMVCLVVEGSEDVEDIFIGDTGISRLRLFSNGDLPRPRLTCFSLGKSYAPHVSEPKNERAENRRQQQLRHEANQKEKAALEARADERRTTTQATGQAPGGSDAVQPPSGSTQANATTTTSDNKPSS